MKYETKHLAPAHIKNASTKQLLELWEMTEHMKRSPELPIVRGWLMDELEARDPDGFDAWLENNCSDAELRQYIKH